VWKVTASLILLKPGMDEKLICSLTQAPLKAFAATTMKVIVECWNWLLSSRPDVEIRFLQEMIFAWHSSQTSRLGLFNLEEDKYSPFAPDEEMKRELRPNNPEIEPHDIWIRFIHVSSAQ
jgi:phosphatidylinositol 4-kinase